MKVKDLIKILKLLPQDQEIGFACNSELTNFERVQTEEVIDFNEFDEEGEPLKQKIITKRKPETTIYFSH